MEVINFFESDRQAYWLEELSKSDWSAGGLLHYRLKSGTFFDMVGEGSKVLLLVDGDALISYCTYAKMDDIQPTDLTPWVGFVYTFPAYRGRRCVGLLLEAADRLARQEHVREIYISTNHVGLYGEGLGGRMVADLCAHCRAGGSRSGTRIGADVWK